MDSARIRVDVVRGGTSLLLSDKAIVVVVVADAAAAFDLGGGAIVSGVAFSALSASTGTFSTCALGSNTMIFEASDAPYSPISCAPLLASPPTSASV